jgi:hypothetical protein
LHAFKGKISRKKSKRHPTGNIRVDRSDGIENRVHDFRGDSGTVEGDGTEESQDDREIGEDSQRGREFD